MQQVNSVSLTNNSPYDVEQNSVHELNTPPADALKFKHLMHLNATNNSEYHIAHIFQHATHLKTFIIDHQNVPFIKHQTDLKELTIPPKSDFFSDEIQTDVKFQLEFLEVESMNNWIDIGNRENILKFFMMIPKMEK